MDSRMHAQYQVKACPGRSSSSIKTIIIAAEAGRMPPPSLTASKRSSPGAHHLEGRGEVLHEDLVDELEQPHEALSISIRHLLDQVAGLRAAEEYTSAG